MWPAITAAPVAPGRGLPVYQPATAVLDGTCSVPGAGQSEPDEPGLDADRRDLQRTSAEGQELTSLASRRPTCLAALAPAAAFPAGVAGRPVWLAQASPAAAPHTMTTPTRAAAAAHGRRMSRVREAWRPYLI